MPAIRMKTAKHVSIPSSEIEMQAVRSQGPGGQNVNKVATAVCLRFDVAASSLSDVVKARLLAMKDTRISSDGVVVIKAQRYRNQEKNKEDALERLCRLIQKALIVPKKRKKTQPTKASRERRLEAKSKHSRLKSSRQRAFADHD